MVKANNLHGLVKHECVVQWYRLGCRLSVGLVQILLKSFANVLLKKSKNMVKVNNLNDLVKHERVL